MVDIVSIFQGLLGANDFVLGDSVPSKYRSDWGVELGAEEPIAALVYPRNAEQVSAVLAKASAAGLSVVPQGGLTGLTGAATPVRGCIVLSLERMAEIEEVDVSASTMVVQAGVTLERVQNAAAEAGFFFPLDLGARGTSQIGGNIATNAGGNRVLRYGMARDLVLGMEVVLADGTVVTSLNKMQKNNVGYDIKQLFIGSEGTLGVVTRLVLRLFPATSTTSTAFCAVASYSRTLDFLHHAKSRLGPSLSAFEMMWPDFYELTASIADRPQPLANDHYGYVLIESFGNDPARDADGFQEMVAEALQQGLIEDAVIAHSLADTAGLWSLRELPGEFGQVFSPHIDFDISIPIGDIGCFVEKSRAAIQSNWPEARVIFWGHIADSNLHLAVNVTDKKNLAVPIESMIYSQVREFKGAISAEHGIGLLKKPFLDYSRSASEINLMQRIKSALDPNGILNPGKVL